VGDVGEGDGVVFEVDETGGLESVEDGFGGGEAFRGGTVEEDGKVDELVRCFSRCSGRGRKRGEVLLTGILRLSRSTAAMMNVVLCSK